MNGRGNRWMDGWMDGWMDRWVGGWMDGETNSIDNKYMAYVGVFGVILK